MSRRNYVNTDANDMQEYSFYLKKSGNIKHQEKFCRLFSGKCSSRTPREKVNSPISPSVSHWVVRRRAHDVFGLTLEFRDMPISQTDFFKGRATKKNLHPSEP